jgi:hypothetical protein
LSDIRLREQVEPGLWALVLGHRDGTVQRHHRVRRDPFQQLVESQDLRPVGVLGARRLGMDRSDGGLQLVRPDRPVRLEEAPK